MSQLRIINARVITLDGEWPLGRIIPCGEVVIEGGVVRSVSDCSGPHAASREPQAASVIDARGRVLMPAFVDAHTHALYAGDRLDEGELKRRGVSYLDILKSGGGIMATVRAVRAAPEAELVDRLQARLGSMLREGTTTVEVKSGYGLSTEHELKMLRAIRVAAIDFPGTVVPTALLGHALDPDVPVERFIDATINETLPAVHAEFPAPRIAIDAFCEQGAWPLEACIRLFERAIALGHPIRVHTDQFNALGMTEWAVDHGAISVDHLEASTESGLLKLAKSDTFGVMLPACGFHLDGRYAKGRAFVDMGGALAIATNLNPGSAPCFSMPFIIALAVRHLGLSPAEAIAAATINPASLLGLPDSGWIGPGARADLIILRHTDERNLAFEFGGNHIHEVIHAGTPLFQIGLLDR